MGVQEWKETIVKLVLQDGSPLTTPQILLIVRCFLTKGVEWYASYDAIRWFEYVTGSSFHLLWIRDKDFPLFSLLVVTHRDDDLKSNNNLLRLSYENNLLYYLHDNSYINVNINYAPLEEHLHFYPNLVPFYKRYLLERDGNGELKEAMRSTLSLVEETEENGRRCITIRKVVGEVRHVSSTYRE